MGCRYEFSRDNINKIQTTTVIAANCPEFVHSCLEFIYVKSGMMRISIDGVCFHVGAGEMAAIASFTPHSSRVTEEGEMYLSMIPRGYVRRYDKTLNEKSFENPVVSDPDGYILDVTRLLFRTNGRSDRFGGGTDPAFTDSPELLYDARCRAAELLVAAAIHSCGLVNRNSGTRNIFGAVSYIDSHFRERLTVSDIAKALYMNQQSLSSEFREAMGISITNYISRVRIYEVANLITQDPEITLTEAAERAGYQSMRTMLRDFSLEFGTTPGGYRKSETAVPIRHQPYQKT